MIAGRPPSVPPRRITSYCQIAAAAVLALSTIFGRPAAAADGLDREVTLDIPAQPLAGALVQFGRQANMQIMLAPNAGDGQNSKELHGTLRASAALSTLLRGSGLSYQASDNTVTVVFATDARASDTKSFRVAEGETSQQPAPGEDQVPSEGPSNGGRPETGKHDSNPLEEVVITGSYIRGTPPDSEPLTIYDRNAIEQAGAVTIAEFASTMTENLSSLTTLNASIGLPVPGGAQSGGAIGDQSGFNIHGLGPEATLTLLDGVRLASAGDNAEFVDTSIIPTAAVKQVEVLTDGASAIYGSDAVAGVVNIILRDDFTGAESSVKYGAPTRSGGGDQLTASQLFGDSWGDGHVMLVYQFNKEGSLNASGRDFIPSVADGGQLFLSPSVEKNSAILTVAQSLGDSTKVSSDLLYSGMTSTNDLALNNLTPVFEVDQSGVSNQYGATLALNHQFLHDWQGNLVGTYSKALLNFDVSLYLPAIPGTFHSEPLTQYDSSLGSVHVDGNGPIATLPGGVVKLAFGAEYRRETFLNTGLLVDGTVPTLARHIESGFAEILVPFVGDDNSFRGFQRLQLSLAGRYDDYSDFGGTTNPHVGLSWSPIKGFNLRSTFARAFRAPDLTESGFFVPEASALYVPNPASPAGQTAIIENTPAGNPSLRPETSRTYTFGADLHPPDLDRLHVSATYFYTLFENVISTPPCPVADCYFEPYNAPYLNTSPSLQEIQQLFSIPLFYNDGNFSPADIKAIFNDGLTNLSRYTQSGLDVAASYSVPLHIGSLKLGEAASYFFRNDFLTAEGLPEVSLLNGVGEPLKFRSRSSVGWSVGGFSSLLTADYRNGYSNEFQTPQQNVSRWTTVDLHLGYEFKDPGNTWLTRGTRVAVHVTNLFDRNPPAVEVPSAVSSINLGFDPVNANPFGRVVALSVDKKW
jgi:iron complex outermembrane recepter protein